jgi:choline dehydrogenase
MRLTRQLLATQPMASVINRERDPGPACQSDAALIDFMRAKSSTVFHPTGTCRMGRDAHAVVDHRLLVHGLQGLRVVDASIMPQVTSGNTNAPIIMIAEKAAGMMLGPSQ